MLFAIFNILNDEVAEANNKIMQFHLLDRMYTREYNTKIHIVDDCTIEETLSKVTVTSKIVE
jgi:hypothetical protein